MASTGLVARVLYPDKTTESGWQLLPVHFDSPRAPPGFVFGTEPTCDFTLPPGELSKRHFALTYKDGFDDGYPRLVVRDLGSTAGTSVTFDGKGEGLRRNFDWIISCFEFPNNTNVFTVHLGEEYQFRIVVERHDITTPAYLANVKKFRQGRADPDRLLGGLDLRTGRATDLAANLAPEPAARPQAKAPTLSESPITHTLGGIGRGGFGLVTREWNVSTGEELACKALLPDRRNSLWDKEISIMKGLSHDHIVCVRFATPAPRPRLFLEYAPGGSLWAQHCRASFSPGERVAILRQCLLALVYLHEKPRSIMHRDIKPENILVMRRSPDGDPRGLHVKLADFGLSKTGSLLNSTCGTEFYMAPEVGRGDYTNAVDIWSLGIAIVRLRKTTPGLAWSRNIDRYLSSSPNEDGLASVLRDMLAFEPSARASAAECLRRVSQLFESSVAPPSTPAIAPPAVPFVAPPRHGSATPTAALYAAGDGEATIRRLSGDRDEENEEEEEDDENLSEGDRSYVPSETR